MTHRGLTWDHPRGYNAPAAAAERSGPRGQPVIAWDKQPLEGFESHPIDELAPRYDLLVLDHPHIGEAVALDCLTPLEAVFAAEEIDAWRAQTVGPAMASYAWEGRHYALPLDVATQVMAYCGDLIAGEPPSTWDDVAGLANEAPVALSISGPHAICTFFSICVALGEEPGGDDLVEASTAREALSLIGKLAARAPQGTDALNPIRLLETMATSDAIALVPLVYDYVTCARTVSGRRTVAFADAPVLARAGRPGSVLGGTGIALTRRAKPDAVLLDHVRWLMRPDVQSDFIPAHDGQPSARVTWQSERVNAAVGGFYRATLATVERAWVRPRHNGCIAFQNAGSAIVRTGLGEGPAFTATIEKLRGAWARSRAARLEPAS